MAGKSRAIQRAFADKSLDPTRALGFLTPEVSKALPTPAFCNSLRQRRSSIEVSPKPTILKALRPYILPIGP